MKSSHKTGILLAILAAALYAINAPFSKLLLDYVPSTLMAGLLYLGAGLGMAVIAGIRRIRKLPRTEEPLTRADLPYTLAMIVLDIAAPILMLLGLSLTTAANASLLNNFEVVATALIALCVFREAISPRLWAGIAFVTASCALLSFEDVTALRPEAGSLFILAACVCWGIENNCTRRLSAKDPLVIVLIKGLCSGTGSLIIGLIIGESVTSLVAVPAVLAVGFVAYGLSIFCYVYAQRMLGAARTGAYRDGTRRRMPSRPSSEPCSPSSSSATRRPPPIMWPFFLWRQARFWPRGMSRCSRRSVEFVLSLQP